MHRNHKHTLVFYVWAFDPLLSPHLRRLGDLRGFLPCPLLLARVSVAPFTTLRTHGTPSVEAWSDAATAFPGVALRYRQTVVMSPEVILPIK